MNGGLCGFRGFCASGGGSHFPLSRSPNRARAQCSAAGCKPDEGRAVEGPGDSNPGLNCHPHSFSLTHQSPHTTPHHTSRRLPLTYPLLLWSSGGCIHSPGRLFSYNGFPAPSLATSWGLKLATHQPSSPGSGISHVLVPLWTACDPVRTTTVVPGLRGAMSSNASATPTAQRHPRILACVLCQHRKIKCDRNTPCSNCVKVSLVPSPVRPSWTHSHISSHRQRPMSLAPPAHQLRRANAAGRTRISRSAWPAVRPSSSNMLAVLLLQ